MQISIGGCRVTTLTKSRYVTTVRQIFYSTVSSYIKNSGGGGGGGVNSMGMTICLRQSVLHHIHDRLEYTSLTQLGECLPIVPSMYMAIQTLPLACTLTFPEYVYAQAFNLPDHLLQIILRYLPVRLPLPPLALPVQQWIQTKRQWDNLACQVDPEEILIRNMDNIGRLRLLLL